MTEQVQQTVTGDNMSESESKKAENRAYSRGYAAGRKRSKIELRAEQIKRENRAFLDKAFLAALPACITDNGWKFGEKPISSAEDRTRLAWIFAKEALKQRGHA